MARQSLSGHDFRAPILLNGSAGTSGQLLSSTATGTPAWVTESIFSYTTTATAAGSTTLTASSTYQQVFTGTTTQTVVLPVTSTLNLGRAFQIQNDSTGTVTVNSSGGNTVIAVPGGTSATVICILLTGTTAASWTASFDGFTSATGTGAVVRAVSPSLSGTVSITPFTTAGVVTNAATTGQLSSSPQLSLALGGTNSNLTAAAGAVTYSSASALALTAVGTSGQVLSSNGTSAPTWLDAPVGYATTATAGATTTLAATSAYLQVFTGTLAQTVTLPAAPLGKTFNIVNESPSTSITVNASGGGQVSVIPPDSSAYFICVTANGTTAASWVSSLSGFGTVSAQGTGSVVRATSPTLTTPNVGAASGTSLSLTGGQLQMSVATLATTGTVNLDFALDVYKTQPALTGNITYTASNYAAGRSVTVRVINGTTIRTLTFPTGWVFVGTKPTQIAASKTGILTITSFGTTEADCVAAWSVQA